MRSLLCLILPYCKTILPVVERIVVPPTFHQSLLHFGPHRLRTKNNNDKRQACMLSDKEDHAKSVVSPIMRTTSV